MKDKMDKRIFETGNIIKLDPYEEFKLEWLQTHKNLRGCHLAYNKVKPIVKIHEKPFTDTPTNNAEFTYLVG